MTRPEATALGTRNANDATINQTFRLLLCIKNMHQKLVGSTASCRLLMLVAVLFVTPGQRS